MRKTKQLMLASLLAGIVLSGCASTQDNVDSTVDTEKYSSEIEFTKITIGCKRN